MNSVFDPHQNVNLAMCVHTDQPAIEIIWPGDTPGPIHDLAARHASGIVYHVCYETENLASTLDWLKSAGIKAICISPPKPAPLFNGRPVSFYNIRGMGLIEILE
jgi:methylmalonyl-CoA/ethylmalonyl-CoA epimerase